MIYTQKADNNTNPIKKKKKIINEGRRRKIIGIISKRWFKNNLSLLFLEINKNKIIFNCNLIQNYIGEKLEITNFIFNIGLEFDK